MWGKTWLSKLEAHDPAPVERALDDVTRSPAGQPLDPGVLRRGLAASEVVAASAGRAAEELPAAARSLAERCADRLRPLRAQARTALEHIRADPRTRSTRAICTTSPTGPPSRPSTTTATGGPRWTS